MFFYTVMTVLQCKSSVQRDDCFSTKEKADHSFHYCMIITQGLSRLCRELGCLMPVHTLIIRLKILPICGQEKLLIQFCQCQLLLPLKGEYFLPGGLCLLWLPPQGAQATSSILNTDKLTIM